MHASKKPYFDQDASAVNGLINMVDLEWEIKYDPLSEAAKHAMPRAESYRLSI